MPSRMERYADINLTRTAKNKDLYDEIYESKEYPESKRYTNIEGVVKTPVTGNIDIEKIKEIINNREESSRLVQRKAQIKEEIEPIEEEEEPFKNYDLKDMLEQAKNERPADEEYYKLKNIELDILKKLNIEKERNKENEEELKELIDTITNTSKLNKLGDKELSLDLLGDLKSNNNNTVIGSSDAIRKVLDEEKKHEDDSEEIDKSFYTRSMNLTKDLQGLDLKKESNKNVVKIFIIISILVVIAVGGFIIYNLIKK